MRRLFLLATVVGPVAVAGAQSAVPQGTPDADALRRLAAQLGGPQGQGTPKLSSEQLEWMELLAKQAMNDPRMRDQIRSMMREDPALFDRLKNSDPKLADAIRHQLPRPKDDPFVGPRPPRPPQSGEEHRPPPGTPRFPSDPGSPSNDSRNQRPPNPTENREYQEVAKLWEQSVGPLDDTPAVRQALIDLFSGAGAPKPGQKPFWADWDLKNANGPNGSGFAKWLQGLNGGTGNANFKMPKWLGGAAPDIKAPQVNLPTAPKLPSMNFGGFDIGFGGVSGLGGAGTVLLIVVGAALVAFLVWKFAPQLGLSGARSPQPLPGLGPWPIDPRTIADRAGVIVAFEYMSVLLCGDGARVWNHATIADALRDAVPAAAPFAEPLAKLYALARYAPQADDLTDDAVIEARGYLCQLAGVPAP